ERDALLSGKLSRQRLEPIEEILVRHQVDRQRRAVEQVVLEVLVDVLTPLHLGRCDVGPALDYVLLIILLGAGGELVERTMGPCVGLHRKLPCACEMAIRCSACEAASSSAPWWTPWRWNGTSGKRLRMVR